MRKNRNRDNWISGHSHLRPHRRSLLRHPPGRQNPLTHRSQRFLLGRMNRRVLCLLRVSRWDDDATKTRSSGRVFGTTGPAGSTPFSTRSDLVIPLSLSQPRWGTNPTGSAIPTRSDTVIRNIAKPASVGTARNNFLRTFRVVVIDGDAFPPLWLDD